MQNILRRDFSAKIKGGLFHIIFCSKPLPLHVTPFNVRVAAVGGNNAFIKKRIDVFDEFFIILNSAVWKFRPVPKSC